MTHTPSPSHTHTQPHTDLHKQQRRLQLGEGADGVRCCGALEHSDGLLHVVVVVVVVVVMCNELKVVCVCARACVLGVVRRV